jgi:hypothetical protein
MLRLAKKIVEPIRLWYCESEKDVPDWLNRLYYRIVDGITKQMRV